MSDFVDYFDGTNVVPVQNGVPSGFTYTGNQITITDVYLVPAQDFRFKVTATVASLNLTYSPSPPHIYMYFYQNNTLMGNGLVVSGSTLVSSVAPPRNRIVFNQQSGGNHTGVFTFTGTVCFAPTTNIIMFDKTTKQICQILRGDIVLSDIETNELNEVKRIITTPNYKLINKIPKNLIGNSDDIICTDHPLWFYDNNTKQQHRIFPNKIIGCEKIKYNGFLYNIQFENDSTFYANNVKVDSLPPYAKDFRLPIELYTDKSKYSDHIYIGEDDPIRNKPPMCHDLIDPTDDSIKFDTCVNKDNV